MTNKVAWAEINALANTIKSEEYDSTLSPKQPQYISNNKFVILRNSEKKPSPVPRGHFLLRTRGGEASLLSNPVGWRMP